MNAVAEKPAITDAGTQTIGDAPQQPRRRFARRVLRPFALALIAAVAVLTGTWWFAEGRYLVSTDNAYVQGDIAVLGPRIEGDVVAVNVADNQPVRAGEPLLTLDPRDWQARLDQARAASAEAGAAILTAQAQVQQNRALITQADANIAQADAERVRASADAQRASTLAGQGWSSKQANDLAIADQRKAEAALAASQAMRASAQQALAVAQAQAAQSAAHKMNADAAVKLAENNLSYTVIRAPFDGIAGNRAAQLGMHVLPAQQLIAVAPAAERLYVTANFKETQLGRMKVGQKVVLTPDIDGAAVTGRVDSLAPATGALFSLLPPENATGNFTKIVQRVPVKIAIDPADAARAEWLRAGLSVTAEVDTRGPDAQRLGLFGVAAATLHLR
ncbi:MAG TPA: HlyD family secretion protein [Acetobacteraceae bacterium]|nr:HlyD family secretion protein [Acetobacteraceae bacterium]